jgi:signal transduction histidine kinase
MPFCNNLIKGIKNGPGFFTEEFTQQEKEEYFTELFKHSPWSELSNREKNITLRSKGGYTRSCCVLDHTSILIINHSGRKFSKDENNVLKRFSKVFEQAYIRFMDLQKAEEQAREAKIEVALEKIRSQVTAMQGSTDLFDIVVSMRKEFISLGHEADYFWHMRWLSDKYEMSMTSEDGNRIGMVITVPKFVHEGIESLHRWEQSNSPSFVLALDGKAAWDYIDKMNTYGHYEKVDPHAPTEEDIHHLGGLTFILARTSHGEIGFSLAGEVPTPPKESLETLERFAGVFDLAYRRFEDLKEAENKAQKILEERDRLEKALSELKATQTQLIHAEKMASLGELTAGIAHEIQNPLNFVNNFSEVSEEMIDEVNEEMDSGDVEEAKMILQDLKSNLEKIHHHGKRADSIVKGMLMHSSSNKGEKMATDINDLCDEFLRLSYHGLRAKDRNFNAEFETHFDESIPRIEVVPQDIGRVLLNLINNAFQASVEKPLQGIGALEGVNGLVKVTTKNLGDKVRISVSDNGPGIPDNIKDKIFQPFFTTKPTGEGTGLGLSLAYDIVKAHGGELKVETKEGEGCEFIMHIPIIAGKTEKP